MSMKQNKQQKDIKMKTTTVKYDLIGIKKAFKVSDYNFEPVLELVWDTIGAEYSLSHNWEIIEGTRTIKITNNCDETYIVDVDGVSLETKELTQEELSGENRKARLDEMFYQEESEASSQRYNELSSMTESEINTLKGVN